MHRSSCRKNLFLVCCVFFLIPCQCPAKYAGGDNKDPLAFSEDSVFIDLSKYQRNGEFIITDTIDLQNKTLYLPEDASLVMKKGMFKNGCVVGNNTRLKYKKAVFDRVRIKGSWIIPRINTSMFKDLSYDNSLKDVFALANPEIANQIYVEKGTYYVTVTESAPRCLVIDSNTSLIIDGSIVLRENDLMSYSILHTIGNNISIYGAGSIVGDKPTHTGSTGEWGMGIYIFGGENVSVRGLSIKDCWGDCIYIRRNAKNVIIENCVIDNGRRQGISIISAENVLVRKCKITNIDGTNPAYAIDVEPNQGDVVRLVRIENVEVNNCRGGFESNGYATDAIIEAISVKNCTIEKTKRWPLRFRRTDAISIDGCSIKGYKGSQYILLNDINDADISNIINDGKRIKQNDAVMGAISSENVKRILINNKR